MPNMIPENDIKFLRRAMRQLGIKEVELVEDPSRAKWPDIWVTTGAGRPVITVTQEWARQKPAERRKRLVHELKHLNGERHGRKKGGLLYSTRPEKDSYSRAIYKTIA